MIFGRRRQVRFPVLWFLIFTYVFFDSGSSPKPAINDWTAEVIAPEKKMVIWLGASDEL
jgi:hypothetical protein